MSNHEKESREGHPFQSTVPDFIPTSWANGRGGRPVSEASRRDADRDGVEHSPSNMSDWLMTEENVMSSHTDNTTATDKNKIMVAFVKISIMLSITAASVGLGCAALWFAVSMVRGMLNAIG